MHVVRPQHGHGARCGEHRRCHRATVGVPARQQSQYVRLCACGSVASAVDKPVILLEPEIKALVMKSREIFMNQGVLLEVRTRRARASCPVSCLRYFT